MIYAIGDIHGHLRRLDNLLEQIPLRQGDQLVFIGDYVDRGPNSAGVIDRLLTLPDNTIFLRGNHEHMMVLARQRFDPNWDSGLDHPSFDMASLWFAEGGSATIRSYKERCQGTEARWWEMVPKEHWHFITTTQMEYVTPIYHFVHAGLLPDGCMWDDDLLQADPRLWIREPFLSDTTCDFGGRWVIFGHTPQRSGRPLIRGNKIGIDTGAAFGGPLTAVALDPVTPTVAAVYQAK